ncbi:MAG: energy-coupling factor ABC transporter ATP-binding protein [Ruminococcus sp.]|nr:energy-coupling factor ABC transporter ATP-binding protein [Ruminococcus sp.]
METLDVRDLTFTYPLCNAPAVSNVSFKVEKGTFNVLCGATGSGKSTLLRLLKREIAPLGEKNGQVFFCGTDIDSLDDRKAAACIGFVMQQPEQQIVTDKVWHELAFGLENLGMTSAEISRRTAEVASFFGIGPWYEKETSELSGGQKQLLSLASVLAMQPELLILDEPTAQLDPIAASEFISALKKLNSELGLTIILAEHRLEEVVPICDRLLVMEKGSLIADGAPRQVIAGLASKPEILCGMPAASRLFTQLGGKGECPLTIREGREFLEKTISGQIQRLNRSETLVSGDKALEFKSVFFRYSKSSPDVLCGLDFSVNTGEIFCILGGNGSGKTTSLAAAAGLIKPYAGTIKVFGKKLKEYKNRSLYRNCLAMLPQDVQTVFLKNTLREELSDVSCDPKSLPYDITHLLDKHPYDLSGGEQQLAAMAKVLAAHPKLLLLDEPTKGLDPASKGKIIEVIKRLKENGVTICIVTHDVEFAASCADRCAMFFAGRIVSIAPPNSFFSANTFYTTAISRMTRGIFQNAVTIDDALELCERNGGCS